MNTQWWRVLRAATAVGVVLTLLAGCAPSSAEDVVPSTGCAGNANGALVLGVSGRMGSPAPVLSGVPLRVVVAAIAAGRHIALVNMDGDPEVVAHYPPLEQSRGTTGYDRAVRNHVDDIAADVMRVRADTPQIDVLASLDLAARVGGDLSDDPPTIVLADSLLSTVPPVDFTDPGMLAADPADIIQQLRATSRLIDLRGSSVLFYGVGIVANPQEPIPPGLRTGIADIWEAVASAAGAACVESFESGGSEPVTEVPEVDRVRVPEPEGIGLPGQPVVLGSDVLRFHPDTAEFVDREEARRVIDLVAARLVRQSPMCANIVGTAATGIAGRGPDAVALSDERAHAVVGLLIAAGIPKSALRPSGIGAAPFEGRVNDIDPAGVPIPAASALNRTVRIEPCTCPANDR